jgi:hypothetical protein
LTLSIPSHGLRVFTQNGQSKRIVEDATLFQNLMRGAVSGRS